MFNKGTIALAAGVTVGMFAAPRVLNMLNIPASEGFGLDDAVAILVTVGSVLLVEKFMG